MEAQSHDSAPRSSPPSGNLDVLRATAVLFVVISHLPGVFAFFEGSAYQVGSLGKLGVFIFFVHTCLVLMMSLERQTAAHGPERRTCAFLLRRLFRIYPLSIAVVLVTHASPATFDHPPVDTAVTLTNVLLVQNLTGHGSFPLPLWSLPFEVQMYIVLPLLYGLVTRLGRHAARGLALCWAGVVGIVLLFYVMGAVYDLVKYVPCFLPGVMAYALRGERKTLPGWCLFAFVGGVAVAFPVSVALGAPETVLSWPICLTLGWLIPRCREIENARTLRICQTIAKYSYGVYLVHLPCVGLVTVVLATFPASIRWAAWVAVVAVLSWIAYLAIERPGIEIGNRAAKRWQSATRSRTRRT